MDIEDVSGSFLVGLSILVAILASYTALSLSGRITAAEPSARRLWIMAAAIAFGGGTWTMHFVGMLALSMPARYELSRTLISLLVPIVAGGIGFRALSRKQGRKTLAWSGLLVCCGVVVMHYTGMAAMEMPGGRVSYDLLLVVASIVIAVAASTLALWMAFSVSGPVTRVIGAVVMGGAISGMHYTAMSAATVQMDHRTIITATATVPKAILALGVIGAATYLLLLALVMAFFDRKLSVLTTHEAEALNRSEQRHRLLTENSSDIIGILDSSGCFLYESSSALQHLGYRSDEIVGRKLTDFIPADSGTDARRFLTSVLHQPGIAKVLEVTLVHKSGDLRIFEILATNLLDMPPIAGIAVNLRDVTERTKLRAQLERLSETDLLTDSLNRRGFIRFAELELQRARLAGERLAIVMMDIDYFKQVNDRFGHAAGDLVLATIAKACTRQIRECDLFGRIGGEEFAFLLPRSTMAGAREMVDRLRARVAACEVLTIRGNLSVTASFGIAYIDPAVTEFTDALSCADEALYEAKQAGRDCVKVNQFLTR